MNGALTITAPKKAALELNAIFENATVGILFTHNRKLMQANRLCAEMFGYRLDEFLGHSALILYESAEAYSALGREAGPVLSRGESFKAETRLKRRDGSLPRPAPDRVQGSRSRHRRGVFKERTRNRPRVGNHADALLGRVRTHRRPLVFPPPPALLLVCQRSQQTARR
jgi:PAS domain S-box-containing protein